MEIIAISLAGSLLMLFILMPLYIYMKRKRFRNESKNAQLKKYDAMSLTVKGSATGVAVLFCFLGVLRAQRLTAAELPQGFETNWWIFVGLLICMAADVLLGIHFVTGMLAFLAGHICYIVYFLTIGSFQWISLPVLFLAVLLVFAFFSKYRNKAQGNPLCYLLYGIVILTTISVGIFLPLSIGEYGLLPAMAAVMLVVSDYMLAYMLVFKVTPIMDTVSLGFYYGGQYVMAMSVFLPAFLPAAFR